MRQNRSRITFQANFSPFNFPIKKNRQEMSTILGRKKISLYLKTNWRDCARLGCNLYLKIELFLLILNLAIMRRKRNPNKISVVYSCWWRRSKWRRKTSFRAIFDSKPKENTKNFLDSKFLISILQVNYFVCGVISPSQRNGSIIPSDGSLCFITIHLLLMKSGEPYGIYSSIPKIIILQGPLQTKRKCASWKDETKKSEMMLGNLDSNQLSSR